MCMRRKTLSIALALVSSLAYCDGLPKSYLHSSKTKLPKYYDNVRQGFDTEKELSKFHVSPNEMGLLKRRNNVDQNSDAKKELSKLSNADCKTESTRKLHWDSGNFSVGDVWIIGKAVIVASIPLASSIIIKCVKRKKRAAKCKLLERAGVKLSCDDYDTFRFSFGSGEKKVCLYLQVCSINGNLAIASSNGSSCRKPFHGDFKDIDKKMFAKLVRHACELASESGYQPLGIGTKDEWMSKIVDALTYLWFFEDIGKIVLNKKLKVWVFEPDSVREVNGHKFDRIKFLDNNLTISKVNKN